MNTRDRYIRQYGQLPRIDPGSVCITLVMAMICAAGTVVGFILLFLCGGQ